MHSCVTTTKNWSIWKNQKTSHQLSTEVMEEIALLIVEDSPTDIQLIKECLLEEHLFTFTFYETGSLNGALELIPHYKIDAVLLDLNLPDSEGIGTVRKITAELPDTAVIVLTGIQDSNLAIQAVRYGAQDFFEKSKMSTAFLSKSIRYSIERKKGLQDREDLLNDLNLALQKIELLENLLPLCSGCNKILGKDNKWHALEDFKQKISTSKNENMICPECIQSLT